MPAGDVERRLTTILAADVVGYSRLTGIDEEGTIKRLRVLTRDLIDPAIAEHRGRVVKRTGDGVLVEFASVVDAVRCAIAVQDGTTERDRDMPEERRIVFRVGINLGDVVVEQDGDLMGDGVNVAARLEGIAKPGSICLSRAAYDQIKGKLHLPVHDLGEQKLKNIAEPVRAYLIDLGIAPSRGVSLPRSRVIIAAAAAAILVLTGVVGVRSYLFRETTAPTPGSSLVVLPFSNLGGDPGQDYIADVLTDELTTYLARLPGTFVIARNTAFTYKGKPVDVTRVGKELKVRYVLEGSIQPIGNRIRTNAQLVDVESGAHLWADQFDEDKTDLLATEDAIVTRLARTLQIQIASVEVARVQRGHTDDTGADELALRCYAIFLNSTTLRGRTEAAYPLCDKALQIDPRNLRALTLLARLHAGRLISLQSPDRVADLANAEDMMSRAFAIDPDQSLILQAKAIVLQAKGNSAEAVIEAQRAIDRNPSDIGAYAVMCYILNGDTQWTKAIDYADKAIRLSPRDPFLFVFYAQIGRAEIGLQHYDRAVEWFRRSVAENPDFPTPIANLASELALNGHEAEAREVLARYLAHPRTVTRTIDQLRAQAHGPGDTVQFDRFLLGLRKAGMPEK